MSNNPNGVNPVKPFSDEQWRQMLIMLNETIPQSEDLLNRSKQAGLDVTVPMQQLQESKTKLKAIVDAWKDKY